MSSVLPFALIGAVADGLLCLESGWSGGKLALMAAVLFFAFTLAAMLVYVIAAFIMTLFVDKSKPQQGYDRLFRRILDRAVCWILLFTNVRVHVSGLEKIPEGRWLMVCNHRSNFDPIVAIKALRDYEAAFISKPANFRLPLVGGVIHKCGFLPIDRENDRNALKTIIEASKRIKNDEMSFVIYPEGTRSHSTELLPFRNGAFKVAQKAKAPVVVARIANTELAAKNAPFKPTHVYFDIIEVIDAGKVSAMKTAELGEEARRCIMCENV